MIKENGDRKKWVMQKTQINLWDECLEFFMFPSYDLGKHEGHHKDDIKLWFTIPKARNNFIAKKFIVTWNLISFWGLSD